jgi:hypothetical protein
MTIHMFFLVTIDNTYVLTEYIESKYLKYQSPKSYFQKNPPLFFFIFLYPKVEKIKALCLQGNTYTLNLG